MTKVAVIAAQGCEEGETLTIVDIFRRAEIPCDMLGLDGLEISGTHHIAFCCDAEFDGSFDAYDMVILPGGYSGTDAMLASNKLIEALKVAAAAGKLVCAICAAPQVLGRAGLLKGRRYTCYPGVVDKVENAGEWIDAPVVRDGNIITGQGPAFAYAFAYDLVDVLGVDAEVVKNRMIYYNAFAVEGGVPSWETEAGSWPAPEGEAPANKQLTVKKVAVLMPEGCEESETVQIMDLLMRAGLTCKSFATGGSQWVHTMQDMTVRADHMFSAKAVADYDAIVVPGGRTAAAPLIANDEVMDTLRTFDKAGKLVGGLCSGTTVLEASGVLAGHRATGYTGYGAKLTSAQFVADQIAVWDGNIVTSQGPCAPYPFAFKFMEAAGINPQPIKDRLLYDKACGR
ncbi:MAG: DJ-1/PfpI family protein [Atopobiaceae bacterium]|nr:DJ-1/PfpI family protein [Atopobiaceae bacterium]